MNIFDGFTDDELLTAIARSWSVQAARLIRAELIRRMWARHGTHNQGKHHD